MPHQRRWKRGLGSYSYTRPMGRQGVCRALATAADLAATAAAALAASAAALAATTAAASALAAAALALATIVVPTGL